MPPVVDLREDEVHVWRIDLAREPAPLPLPEDEEARLARLRRPEDARRLRAAQVGMRLVLARYLGIAPAALRIARACRHCGDARHGKPHLVDADLRFNLSHAEDLALLAVARREVGVDVEHVAKAKDVDLVARSFFTPEEQARVLAAADKARAFLDVWTRKEALLKLSGKGLATDPREATPDARCRPLDVGASYVAAVAFEGEARVVQRDA